MKVVILAGGFGTRLSEYTEVIPKPMVEIGGIPIIVHLMNYYSKYGFNEFIIALGYKSGHIKDYFSRYINMISDYTIDFSKNSFEFYNKQKLDWKISLIDTGLNSMTGGRVKRLEKYLGNETFLLTYGDGLSNVNLNELIKRHNNSNNVVTVTAVHPIARFGELLINEFNEVKAFKEKPQLGQGYINGGFFVVDPEFFKYLNDDKTILEKEPLEELVSLGKLGAYRHDDFWQCMDTKRDRDYLEELWNGDAPWK